MSTQVRGPYYYTIEGEDVRLKLYAQKPTSSKATVTFKYADVINRAIRYKQTFPEEAVQIHFAIYKIAKDVYVGFKPGTPSYGWVGGTEEYGRFKDARRADSEKLIYSLVKAARHGIDVNFVWHNPQVSQAKDEIHKYLEARKPKGTVQCYRKVKWPEGNKSGQMHNKFVLASHVLADDDAQDGAMKTKADASGKRHRYYTNAVYVATANVDHFGKGSSTWSKPVSSHRLCQTGVCVYNHAKLYESYRAYFEIVYRHASDTTRDNFWGAMTTAHREGLNYRPDEASDPHFAAHFYPVPNAGSSNDGWDLEHNAVAYYLDRLCGASGNRYLKLNVYHIHTDSFTDRAKNAIEGKARGKLDIRSVWKTNTARSKGRWPNYARGDYNKPTHAKNYTFAFSSEKVYVCVTGSANMKRDAFASKANNQLVLRHPGRPHAIYDDFKKFYEFARDA